MSPQFEPKIGHQDSRRISATSAIYLRSSSMATENKSKPNSHPNKINKKRKHYLPHNRPVKKGAHPLCPGVQGFFITCDGGREHQASNEAINVIDSFYEEVVEGIESKVEKLKPSVNPLNKVTKFSYSDSSSSDDEGDDENKDPEDDGQGDGDELQKNNVDEPVTAVNVDLRDEPGPQNEDDASLEKKTQEIEEKPEDHLNQEAEAVVPPVKKQCVRTGTAESGNGSSLKVEKKSIDQLIEAELAELADKGKRLFTKLDPGCNGVAFIQMRKRDGDPSPKDIIQHMMTSLASTRKHMSRFLLRVLPIEITCYASDEEIRRAIKPLVEKYFPEETQTPLKFAVLYEARANTGIDRAKIIGAVAKSVPPPHKVDLGSPNLSIVVQIVKTVCLIGVAERYKELAKYNVRQLTSETT
ncbi:uncharacterized protein [Henckelia pumila]|uniref:uncharacterized protein n=1 Tax=Henckelia pumila TaxID=405737 RepID=UPI003C6DF035